MSSRQRTFLIAVVVGIYLNTLVLAMKVMHP